MMGCIKNFISNGGEYFLFSKDVFGVTFIELIFTLIKRVYEINNLSEDELDMIAVTSLFICVMENNLGKIDNLIPLILDACVGNIFTMNTKRTKLFKVINLEVVRKMNLFIFSV
jgi:hypothetical protein